MKIYSYSLLFLLPNSLSVFTWKLDYLIPVPEITRLGDYEWIFFKPGTEMNVSFFVCMIPPVVNYSEFLKIYSSLLKYTLNTNFPPSHPPSSSHHHPSPRFTTPPFPFGKNKPPKDYQPNIQQQDTIRLGTISFFEAGPGNWVNKKGSIEQLKEPETPPLPLLEVPQKYANRRATEDQCRFHDCHFSLCWKH